MKKERKLTMNIGIISFLMVFIILCMLTFAILSLASSKSNDQTTQNSIFHKLEYYELSNQGEVMLEKIDSYLYQQYQSTSSMEEYFQVLTTIASLDSSITVNEHIIRFECVSKNQKLQVEIEVLYPGSKLYTIQSWKIDSNKEWNPDTNINIL